MFRNRFLFVYSGVFPFKPANLEYRREEKPRVWSILEIAHNPFLLRFMQCQFMLHKDLVSKVETAVFEVRWRQKKKLSEKREGLIFNSYKF